MLFRSVKELGELIDQVKKDATSQQDVNDIIKEFILKKKKEGKMVDFQENKNLLDVMISIFVFNSWSSGEGWNGFCKLIFFKYFSIKLINEKILILRKLVKKI